jgi:hypothetical protein
MFDPRSSVPALHGVWASDPAWSNPGDGQPVTSWRNFSADGGGGDPASTGSNRPTFRASTATYNGRATVQFVGASSQRLDVNIVPNTQQPFKLVVVGNTAGASGTSERLVGSGSPGTGGVTNRGLGDTSGNLWTLFYGTALSVGTSSATPHLFRATVNGANSLLYVDDQLIGSGAVGAESQDRLTIGAGSDGAPGFGNFLTGHVAFVGIYDGRTPDDHLTELSAFLRAFYAI